MRLKVIDQKRLFTLLTKGGIVLWSKSLLTQISRIQLTISESKSEKHNFCNNSVKLNARNVITGIGFLIANEYLIFCGITRLAYQKILQLAYTEEFLEILDKFAHDKLSIKFKEIAEESKNLVSVNDFFTNPIISEDEITHNIQDLHLRSGKRGHG
ncbi:hypothetical protein RhiirA4_459144 [Rhizophagus irregularis]|uniref:Uncharacterized protein n=1 Tax=Rhizophagus irregularis TaxID=588596 RepID=A0A2I1GDS4_9GLOM|nr:hypothetical protein RhiirA4_459144 [Rhizophagus irregularis]